MYDEEFDAEHYISQLLEEETFIIDEDDWVK